MTNPNVNKNPSDSFQLYDLRVEIVRIEGEAITDGAQVGDYFLVQGENLIFPENTRGFSMYNLAAIIPLLPAKQRVTHPNDWMTTDSEISSVDANCGVVFSIIREKLRTFYHSDVSGNSLLTND